MNTKLDVTASSRPYVFVGDKNNTKTLMEKIRSVLMTEETFSPIRDREDFKALIALTE